MADTAAGVAKSESTFFVTMMNNVQTSMTIISEGAMCEIHF
jgi:hypothetical protein